MSKNYEIVLIGGDYDGERLTISKEIWQEGKLYKMRKVKVPSRCPDGTDVVPYIYHRHDLYLDNEFFSFWVAPGISPKQIYPLLLKGYRQPRS